jgi:hypothetical protein
MLKEAREFFRGELMGRAEAMKLAESAVQPQRLDLPASRGSRAGCDSHGLCDEQTRFPPNLAARVSLTAHIPPHQLRIGGTDSQKSAFGRAAGQPLAIEWKEHDMGL